MAIEFRMLERGDYTEHQNLKSMAFGRGGIRPPLAEDVPDPVGLLSTIAIFEDGKLMSSVTVEPYRVHFGYGTQLDYGGIGGVACANERRGRGYVQQLLIRSLALMEEQGQTISGLYPFAYAFYRKFGWEYVGHVQNIKLPVRELKRYSPAGWDVSEIDLEANLELVKPFYDSVAANYRSAFTASTHKWHDDYNAHDNRKSFVYIARDENGELGGLLRFRYPAHGSDDLPTATRLWTKSPAAWPQGFFHGRFKSGPVKRRSCPRLGGACALDPPGRDRTRRWATGAATWPPRPSARESRGSWSARQWP